MNINWKKLRQEEFPNLDKNGLTYLMAAGASIMSQSAYQEVEDYIYEMTNYGDLNFNKFVLKLESLRKILSEYLNTSSDQIGFLPNTSSGMLYAAYLLKNFKGEVIYPSYEFPASIHMFKRLNYILKEIPSINGGFSLTKIKSVISNHTKISIHSHVQSLNGFRQDLEQLGYLCKENNIINVINATQSFSVFDIDVIKDNIDILVANGLKWTCSGYGTGIMYIRSSPIFNNNIPFTSWLSVKNPFLMDNKNLNFLKKPRSIDSFGGCPHYAAMMALFGSMNMIKKRIGNGNIKKAVKTIQKRILYLIDLFVRDLEELNIEIISPKQEKSRSGIITIKHKKARLIHRKLKKHKIYTTLKKFPEDKYPNLIRFAINYYNNEDDILKTIQKLKEILKISKI